MTPPKRKSGCRLGEKICSIEVAINLVKFEMLCSDSIMHKVNAKDQAMHVSLSATGVGEV